MLVGERFAKAEGGFTFVVVLAMVALTAAWLSAVGPSWADQSRREREKELLRVGAIYAKAIGDYYRFSPGTPKSFPPELGSLLEDTRFVGVRRHLRRLYSDPLEPSRAWGLVRSSEGRVVGIYSLDQRTPFTQVSIDLDQVALPAARHYTDWKFVPEIQK